jgi:anti-sigma factor RsiW
MRPLGAHVRSCPCCSQRMLLRALQMKRALQVAGKRFIPSTDFRRRLAQSITPKPKRSFPPRWMLAAAATVILVVGALASNYVETRPGIERASRYHVFSEIADLHVVTFASPSPVDVISTDRHTVKPWFQGKFPFAFTLPELQDSEFFLLGGRMTYLDQAPGTHLIYDVRKHHISVFVFPERSLSLQLTASLGERSLSEEPAVEHSNVESRGHSLFRDRRREYGGHR